MQNTSRSTRSSGASYAVHNYSYREHTHTQSTSLTHQQNMDHLCNMILEKKENDYWQAIFESMILFICKPRIMLKIKT